MALAIRQDIGELVFQLGLKDDVPAGVSALVYLVNDEILFPQRDWKALSYLPIADHLGSDASHDASFPGVNWLDMAVDAVKHFVRQGWPTAIMSREGNCRAAMVHTAYLIKAYGLSLPDALSYVNKLAPQTKIEHHFTKGLKQYELYLNSEICPCRLTYDYL